MLTRVLYTCSATRVLAVLQAGLPMHFLALCAAEGHKEYGDHVKDAHGHSPATGIETHEELRKTYKR